MTARVSAVVFDLGGVITESPISRFTAYEAEAGLPEGLIVRINSTDPDSQALASLNVALAADPRWETVLLPLSDGLTVLRVR